MMIDLIQFFRAIDPGESLNIKNPEQRQYYIDFSSVRGGKIIEELKENITIYYRDRPTCDLFTGHIGCGKSTELLRLKAELEEEGFHVVYFESSKDLEMADVDIGDVLLAIALRVSQSLENLTISEPRRLGKLLRGAAKLLLTEIEFQKFELGWPEGIGLPKGLKFGFSANNQGEFSVAMGIGTIAAKAKSDATLRARLNQFLGPQKNELLTAINQELIKPAITQLKHQGKKGLVAMVDNLDRIDAQNKNWGRPQQEYLFVDQAEFLQKLNCHLVYTMPLALKFSDDFGRLMMRFPNDPKVLPMVQVQLKNGDDCSEGMALLRQMVLARAFPDLNETERLNKISEVFDHPDTLDRLCWVSGGNERDLLQLLMDWIKKDRKQGFLCRKTLEKVIRARRNEITMYIDDRQWELLRQVRLRKKVSGNQGYQNLIRSRLVFEYRDRGESWFDINPILADAPELNS
ncbi:MAG: ATP-binding protein [Xenococcaceae cyanobacterium]